MPREMKTARHGPCALVERRESASEIAAINSLGYLSSNYDIYQDVYPTDAPKGLNKAGWPDDLVFLAKMESG